MLGVLFQEIISGFVVKSIASFDDTLTRIPVVAEMTRGKRGKIAFSIGTLLALTVVIIFVIPLSFLLDLIPYRRYVVASLILLLGIAVYLELFSSKKEEKIEHKILQGEHVSNGHLLKLVGVGFVVSLVTNLDDIVVLIPLFLDHDGTKFYSIVGIYLATFIQIAVVIFFSHKINRIKYKKEIASSALIILAVLVGAGVV